MAVYDTKYKSIGQMLIGFNARKSAVEQSYMEAYGKYQKQSVTFLGRCFYELSNATKDEDTTCLSDKLEKLL